MAIYVAKGEAVGLRRLDLVESWDGERGSFGLGGAKVRGRRERKTRGGWEFNGPGGNSNRVQQ